MLTTRLAALGLAAALALPLAAAGSKSSESSTSNTSASSITIAKSGGSTGGSTSGGGSSSGTPSSGDCLKAAGQFSTLTAKASSALAPGQSVDAAELQNELNNVKGSVPENLQKDMQTWADAYGQFINNIKDLNLSDPSAYTNPATLQKLQDATKPLDSSEFKTAQSNIEAYFNKCQATP